MTTYIPVNGSRSIHRNNLYEMMVDASLFEYNYTNGLGSDQTSIYRSIKSSLRHKYVRLSICQSISLEILHWNVRRFDGSRSVNTCWWEGG
jgi:hypothetical protein